MTDERAHVRVRGPERQVVDLEDSLGTDVILRLALAAKRYDVMISLTVSPYVENEGEDVRDPNDAT